MGAQPTCPLCKGQMVFRQEEGTTYRYCPACDFKRELLPGFDG